MSSFVLCRVFGGLMAVNGVAITVAPAKFCESYGIDTAEVSGSSLKIWRRNGIATLASGILAVCLLFRDDSLNLAMGLASLPMAVSAALSLLNNDSETIGPSKAGDLSILAVHGAASLAGLTDASWANVAYKVLAGYALVAGIPLILQPSLATDLWQLKEEVDDASSRGIGVNYATLGLLVGALALGIETTKAFGCSLLLIWPFIVYQNHINDDLANLGMNKGARAFYTALYLAIAGITLID